MDARERYDELVDDLCARNDDVEPSQMMGMLCEAEREDGRRLHARPDGVQLPDPTRMAGAVEGALFDPGGNGGRSRMGGRAGRTLTVGPRTRRSSRWLNQQPASSSRKTHAFCPDSSTTSK
jgi:hypothetical protein